MRKISSYAPALLSTFLLGCAVPTEIDTACNIAETALTSKSYYNITSERTSLASGIVAGDKDRTESYDGPVQATVRITPEKEPGMYFFNAVVTKKNVNSQNPWDNSDIPEAVSIMSAIQTQLENLVRY